MSEPFNEQLSSEVWESVAFDDFYEVSTHGGLRSAKKNKAGVVKYTTLKATKKKDLYCKTLRSGQGWVLARLILTVFDRPGRDGESAIYKDKDVSNLHLSNLQWSSSGNPNRTPAKKLVSRKVKATHGALGVEIYDSAIDAAEATGIHVSNISKVISSGGIWNGYNFDYFQPLEHDTGARSAGLDAFTKSTGGVVCSDGRVKLPSGRWVKANEGDGYKTISIVCPGHPKGKKHNIHVLVAMAFLAAPPFDNAEVDHINGKKWDNRVENLEYVTGKENTMRAHSSGMVTPYNEQAVKLYKFNKESNDYTFVQEFKSQSEAGRVTGFTDGNISKSCKKPRGDLAKARKFAKNPFFKTHVFRRTGDELVDDGPGADGQANCKKQRVE